MPDDDKIEDLPTKPVDAAAQAREQAAVYDALFAPSTLTFDDGTAISIPPPPSLRMLDDDQQADYDELLFESESYDRADDVEVPEQKVYDKNTGQLITTIPASTRPGPLLVPHRKTDAEGTTVLIKPAWEVRVVRAALGVETYKKLRAGTIGGRPGTARDVWDIWNRQTMAMTGRRDADPKSSGGDVDLAPVPEADSQ